MAYAEGGVGNNAHICKMLYAHNMIIHERSVPGLADVEPPSRSLLNHVEIVRLKSCPRNWKYRARIYPFISSLSLKICYLIAALSTE